MSTKNPAAIAAAREAARNRRTGEFGVQQHSTPDATPLSEKEIANRIVAERLETLQASGYAPVGSAPDAFDPTKTAKRDQWWQTQFALAEQAKGGGFHIMPDDYTPGMGRGQSITGNRRTHRMKYEGAGVTLRMPSVTAIKRYSKDIDGATFDVPVEAKTPAGSVQSYVRISPGPKGTWEVSTPGIEGNSDVAGYLAESVNATLEGRRPSKALGEVQDLAERRRQRIANMGVRMYDAKADSSVVKAVGYAPASREMYVQLGRRQYAYEGAPSSLAGKLYRGYAPGTIYNSQVKGRFPSQQAATCEQCGRVTSVARDHQCPRAHGKATRRMKFERLAIQKALGLREHRSFEKALDRARQERRDWEPAGGSVIDSGHRA
ncbi:MAG: hypothetical protein ACTH0V_00260 [Microbacteriaceae bacterium]